MTCQGCLTVKNSFGIPDIRSKITCGQVDMTFIKATWQLKIVLGFLTSDFSQTRELNLTSMSKYELLYKVF